MLALILLVPVPSLTAHVATGLSPGPIGLTAMAVSKLWILAFPVWWWVRVERQPVRLSRPTRPGLMAGLICGLISIAAIVAAYRMVGVERIPVAALRDIAGRNGWTQPLIFVAFALAYSVGNALLEEYVWRWFVVRQWRAALARGASPSRITTVAAVLLSAMCFTLHHVILLFNQVGLGMAALGGLGVFTGGAVWSWLFARYGSVWPGYVAHVLADAAIFVIGWRLLMVPA